MPKTNIKTIRQQDGERAEQLAQDYLTQQGLSLVEKNFRCKLGEIDLIMQHLNTLVFIEVRYRKSNAFGGAAASITPAKQQKVRRAASYYLQRLTEQPPCRFDVVTLIKNGDDIDCSNWIQNAF